MPADKNAAIFALPGSLKIGSREFVIPAPTITDKMRVRKKMQELARGACVNPLVYVDSIREKLSPMAFTEAIKHAVDKGSGGGGGPHEDAVMEAYDSLEGTRYRVWYSIHRFDSAFTLKDVEPLVTEENYFDVGSSLNEALGLNDVEKKAPSNGESA